MLNKIEIKPQVVKDGRKIPKTDLLRIFEKINLLKNDLQGDVKHLTNFTPEYRLRIGNYRILFEVIENCVIIYRIKHRKDVYR